MWTIQGWYDQARADAAANAAQTAARAEHTLKLYVREIPGMSRAEIGRLIAKSNQDRLNAAPSLTRYPELRGVRELIAAQWRGTKDGASLDGVQAALTADGNYYYHRHIATGRHKHKAKCSWVHFPTSDHGPLLGNNLDTSPDEPYGPPPWPMLNEHLFSGGVSSGIFLDEESPEIFPAPVYPLVARYCRTADEGVELMTRYNHFWGPGNVLLGDRHRRVAMIEKSACRIGVRWSTDGFAFVTAGVAKDPGMAAFLADRRAASLKDRGLTPPCIDTRYWDKQPKRQAIMERLMEDARKAPTLEKLRAIMQYRGADGVVAGNGEIPFPGDPPTEHTIRTQIICLSEGRALWWTRDNERNIPSWENRREDVVFKDVPLWER